MARADAREPEVAIIGSGSLGGAYVLRIRLTRDVAVRFGRFRNGEAIPLPAGTYLYVGSARSAGGSPALARRLLRHATRSGRRRPQGIRRGLSARLAAVGLIDGADLAPRTKRLRWHVDYLLDCHAAEIAGVWALRTERPAEREIARRLADDPGSVLVRKGLGASDDPGGTHLFRIRDPERAWRRVVRDLGNL